MCMHIYIYIYIYIVPDDFACFTKSASRSAARPEPLASVFIIIILRLLNPSLISHWLSIVVYILPLDGDILTYNNMCAVHGLFVFRCSQLAYMCSV